MKDTNEMTAKELDDLIESYKSGACDHEPQIEAYLGEMFTCVCHECKVKAGGRYTVDMAVKAWDRWKRVGK